MRGVTIRRGGRTLVEDLDLDVEPGEFLAILGPNGSGKSSLLQVLLGTLSPTSGTIRVDGRSPGDQSARVGVIPQQRSFDPSLTMRGRDLVRLGIDGNRYGPGLPGTGRKLRGRVEAALDSVSARELADTTMGRMSGGQQQRVRTAQALVGDPRLLCCDEPLLSLDLPGQRTIAGTLRKRKEEDDTAILFVTHEINPVLPLVDRVLYLVDGRHRIGTPEEVITTETLTDLYNFQVDVVEVRGQLVVIGDNQPLVTEPHSHGPPHHEEGHH